jgi:hypothetical protein
MRINTACFYCDKMRYGTPIFGSESITFDDFFLCDKCMDKRRNIYSLKIGER